MADLLPIECPMCYDHYDEEQKIPRNLTCGHTYCEYCLEQIYELKRRIECPSCRKKIFNVKPNDLSKNFIALDLAIKDKQSKNTYDFCQEHKQPLQFYCQTDKINICSECIINHSGHTFQKINISVQVLKKRVNQMAEKIDKKMENSVKQQEDYNLLRTQMKNRLKNDKELVVKKFDKIIKVINERKETVLKELDSFYDQQLSDVELDIVLANSVQDNYKHQLQQLEKLQSKLITNETICFLGEKNKVLMYNVKKDAWILKEINNNKNCEFNYYASAVTLPNGEILIMGGGIQASVSKLSIFNKMELVRLSPMQTPRKEHGSVTVGSKYVYVIGGYNSQKKEMLSSCERYDIKQDKWSYIPSMSVKKCAIAVCQQSDKYIYVMGGFDGKNRLQTIEKYDINEEKWEILDVTLQNALSNSAAIALDDKEILILGGGNDEGFSYKSYSYDTKNQTIQQIPNMKEGRDLRNKIVKYNGLIYAIGGHKYNGSTYNPKTKTWSNISKYDEFVQDHLDSWSCALTYQFVGDNINKLDEMSLNFDQIYSQLQDPQINEYKQGNQIQKNMEHMNQQQPQIQYENNMSNGLMAMQAQAQEYANYFRQQQQQLQDLPNQSNNNNNNILGQQPYQQLPNISQMHHHFNQYQEYWNNQNNIVNPQVQFGQIPHLGRLNSSQSNREVRNQNQNQNVNLQQLPPQRGSRQERQQHFIKQWRNNQNNQFDNNAYNLDQNNLDEYLMQRSQPNFFQSSGMLNVENNNNNNINNINSNQSRVQIRGQNKNLNQNQNQNDEEVKEQNNEVNNNNIHNLQSNNQNQAYLMADIDNSNNDLHQEYQIQQQEDSDISDLDP
ncbi:hypothetical protein PPERSA_01470 [Pseudocohnilembus persalinus]|uniref:RING-type domain-containing protein n=1 Tax=Pseudocohnilembus persalinus TaxID=266149 RepID=A0A0V0QH77_PSEPJ|nr:hypothetical protein PPERSA_01470 [Pseudocohnilembus persalinus]|eukprot:KRX01567.1 hypothetical protein PPERSA_01470 [Pseudocohnilembus persalinus]